MKNRGLKQEGVAKSMGVTKQAINYILNHRVDRDWSDKEIDYWCKVLHIESGKIYELREKVLQEKAC